MSSAETRGSQLTALVIGDDVEAWERAEFAVDDRCVDLGHCRVQLVGATDSRGIVGLSVAGLDIEVDGLPVVHAFDVDEPVAGRVHPNGATSIDHLVVITPDCDRTTAAYEAAGLEARGVRRAEIAGVVRRQTFFWLGDVILELVGSDAADGDGPATMWGLALVCDDLEATAESLGDRCGAVKPAVQPGRWIATIRTRDLGISVPIALMSPHPG